MIGDEAPGGRKRDPGFISVNFIVWGRSLDNRQIQMIKLGFIITALWGPLDLWASSIAIATFGRPWGAWGGVWCGADAGRRTRNHAVPQKRLALAEPPPVTVPEGPGHERRRKRREKTVFGSGGRPWKTHAVGKR